MLNDGVPHGSPSWIGNDDIPLNAVFRISSVIISCLALFYGLSTIDLRNMTTSEPGTCSTIKLFFTELIHKKALFLRVLICINLFFVDENLLTCAIIYTCLDFVTIIVLTVYFFLKEDLEYLKISFIKYIGVKSILDPSRFWFKTIKGDYELDDSGILNFWYSLLGLIFSGIFIAFDFSCDEIESCDQDADRISRFHAFFTFSLVINVLALCYSFISCFYAYNDKTLFQLVSPEEQREEEETNV